MAPSLIHHFSIFNKPFNSLIPHAADEKHLLQEALGGAGAKWFGQQLLLEEKYRKELITSCLSQTILCGIGLRDLLKISVCPPDLKKPLSKTIRGGLLLDPYIQKEASQRMLGRFPALTHWETIPLFPFASEFQSEFSESSLAHSIPSTSSGAQSWVWGEEGLSGTDSFKEKRAEAKAGSVKEGTHYGFLHQFPWRRAHRPVGGHMENASI